MKGQRYTAKHKGAPPSMQVNVGKTKGLPPAKGGKGTKK